MKRYRDVLAAAAGGLLLLAGCTHRPYDMYGGGWEHMMNYGHGGMFMWLLVIFLVAVAAYFVFARQRGDGFPPSQKETPLDVLKKRYAAGEISKEEFLEMKADLEEK